MTPHETRTCPRPGCGAVFLWTRTDRQYCSRKCATRCAHVRRLGHDVEAFAARTCATCKAPLGPNAHGIRRFCSRNCMLRARAPKYERCCPRCATVFVTTRSLKRYCSDLCRYEANKPPALIRGPYKMRTTHRVRTRWTLVDEPFESDGFAYARCRCTRGHEQLVAVDVRPPPACERCQAIPGPAARARLEAREGGVDPCHE